SRASRPGPRSATASCPTPCPRTWRGCPPAPCRWGRTSTGCRWARRSPARRGPSAECSPPRTRCSLRVVEDDAERGAAAGGHGGDAVAHAHAVVALRAAVGPHAGGEDDERAARRPQHVRPALGARALLEQDELAALVLVGEHREHLEREEDVA